MTTPLLDPTAIRENVLDSVKAGQAITLGVVKTVADVVEPLTSLLPPVPFGDLLPRPADTVDAGYAVAADLLAAQRDFARQLLETLTPATEA